MKRNSLFLLHYSHVHGWRYEKGNIGPKKGGCDVDFSEEKKVDHMTKMDNLLKELDQKRRTTGDGRGTMTRKNLPTV